MTSVLEKEYNEPTRPYSRDELSIMKENLYKKLRLGETLACHSHCNHFYLVKKNGRKEKEILEQKSQDIGNCSVCWKIRNTPKELKSTARNLVQGYCEVYYNNPQINYDNVDLERVYYTWLYEENINN
jgi:ribosomal protein L33